MVGQVKVVGILMLVHGITVILMGGVLVTAGVVMLFAPTPPGGGPEPYILAAVYGVWGLLVIACGVLNSVAGYLTMSFRARVFSLVALFSNILVLLTCYCAITAIGMMVYGLVVLFQPDVARAFRLVADGASPDDVVGRFTRRYNDARDDFDDVYRPRREWDDDRRGRDEDLHDDYDRR